MEKTVLVTGGTGNLGRLIGSDLLKKNYTVSVLSSQTGTQPIPGVTFVTGNLVTRQGLPDATAHADFIIHCASNPRNAAEVDVKGTYNLLQAIDSRRTRHIVYISIVGVDKSNYPYYKAKYDAEKVIAESGVPYTILRTTQFHSFVFQIMQGFLNNSDNQKINVPAGIKFQSVDIAEVSRTLVNCLGAPAGLLPDYGGPEVMLFENMVQEYFDIMKDPRAVLTEDFPGERFDLFRSGVNLCPGHKSGKITWRQFLEQGV